MATFGARYSWGSGEGGWESIGAGTVETIGEDFARQPEGYKYEAAVQVDAGKGWVGVDARLDWVYAVGARVMVTDPAGTVYQVGGDRVRLVEATDTSVSLRIGAASGTTMLAPGKYTVTVTAPRSFGPRNSAQDFRLTPAGLVGDAPTLGLGQLSQGRDGSLSVPYTATAVGGLSPKVTLYAVANADQLPDGQAVAEQVVGEGTPPGPLVWANFTSYRPADYRFYAVIDDGVHKPVRADTTATARPPQQAGGAVRRQAGGVLPTALGGWELYLDTDGDGSRSADEPTAYTGADGEYSFGGLPPGTYTLRVGLSGGFRPASDQPVIDGRPGYRVAIGPGQALRLNMNFNLVQESTVEGLAFNDLDGNGCRDPGEGPAAGVDVFLDLDGNGAADPGEPRAVTTSAGGYSFVALDNGAYAVRVLTPAGGRVTTAAGGAAAVTGADQLVGGPTFGLVLPVTISGRAFVERGGWDGYTPGVDTPLPGTLLTLLDGRGRPVVGADGQAMTTIADADGLYQFSPLPPGDYRVVQTPPAGYAAVSGAVEPDGFAAPRPLDGLGLPAGAAYTFTAADADRDGIPDLVATSAGLVQESYRDGYWPVNVLRGVGDGTFRPAVSAVPYESSSRGNTRVAPDQVYGQWLGVTDLNRDGRPTCCW